MFLAVKITILFEYWDKKIPKVIHIIEDTIIPLSYNPTTFFIASVQGSSPVKSLNAGIA